MKLSLLCSPCFLLYTYIPSMYFVTFWRSSWYPSLVYFSIASEGRLPSLNVQVIAGFGKPVALQISLAVFPSGIDWFLGETVIWGETLKNNIFHLAVFLAPKFVLCCNDSNRVKFCLLNIDQWFNLISEYIKDQIFDKTLKFCCCHRLIEMASSRFPDLFGTNESLLQLSERIHVYWESTFSSLWDR